MALLVIAIASYHQGIVHASHSAASTLIYSCVLTQSTCPETYNKRNTNANIYTVSTCMPCACIEPVAVAIQRCDLRQRFDVVVCHHSKAGSGSKDQKDVYA